jgi:hypothetical protein
MRRWDIRTRTAIYHHAHAFNLFSLRTRNLQLALGNIIEDAVTQGFTARDILHAIRDPAHVNEAGRWVHPTNKSEVIVSTQRLAAGHASLPARPNPEQILIATQLLNNDANH